MWSAPWETVEKANEFAKRMQSEWIAKVEHDDEGAFVNIDNIAGMFWQQNSLIGSDDLIDRINDKAGTGCEQFDIRELVTTSLLPELTAMETQLQLPENLEAINIVRKAVGKEALTEDRELEPFQKVGKKIVDLVKSQDFKPFQYFLAIYPSTMEAKHREMLGVPESIGSKDCYCLSFQTKEQKEFAEEGSGIEEIKQVKNERPGFFKIYYTI